MISPHHSHPTNGVGPSNFHRQCPVFGKRDANRNNLPLLIVSVIMANCARRIDNLRCKAVKNIV